MSSTPYIDESVDGCRLDKQLFRRVCGRFATGVTIGTVLDPSGGVHGMTANSFSSVSLTPPMVLFSVDHRAKIVEHFRNCVHFGINMLAEHQRPLSDRFAGTGYDRFDGVPWRRGSTGVPLLFDVLAALECRLVNTVPAGDHDIFIGEVVHADCREGDPLVFYGSQYRQLVAQAAVTGTGA